MYVFFSKIKFLDKMEGGCPIGPTFLFYQKKYSELSMFLSKKVDYSFWNPIFLDIKMSLDRARQYLNFDTIDGPLGVTSKALKPIFHNLR